MHPLLTSREQDLAAVPAHQALLKNLGIGPLLKSQSHAAALHESLRRGSNDHAHSKAPRDPKGLVRKASPDVHLTPAQRAADAARDRADELAYEKRRKAMQAGTNADDDLGHNPEDDDIEEGMSKSLTPGAFERLKTWLHSYLAKSQPRDYDVSDFVRDLHRGPVLSATPSISKSISSAAKRTQKSLGISGMKTIQSKMQSIAKSLGNEQLAKSIGATASMRAAAQSQLPSAEQIEGAAGMALAHGSLSAAQCQMVSAQLALGGPAAVPMDIMNILAGRG